MKPLLFLPLLLVPAVPALRAALPGHTTSSPRPAQAPEAGLAWGDVDGDGLDDVLVVDASARARLLMHFGEGRFEDVTAACGLGEAPLASCALLVDLDGDGHEDLYLGSSETRLWRNLGNGTFEPLASGIDHDLVDLSVQAVDRDEDVRPDLEIHTEAGDLVYRNLGKAASSASSCRSASPRRSRRGTSARSRPRPWVPPTRSPPTPGRPRSGASIAGRAAASLAASRAVPGPSPACSVTTLSKSPVPSRPGS